MEDSKKIVREKYRNSTCEKQAQSNPVGSEAVESWAVSASPGGSVIAVGRNEFQAWVNAASEVLSTLPKPTGVVVSDETRQDAAVMKQSDALNQAIEEAKRVVEDGNK